MANRVVAFLENKKVEVSMLANNFLTIYEYIDNKTVSMRVITHIAKQDYKINADSGKIELSEDCVFPRILKINPIFFDEITKGKWD